MMKIWQTRKLTRAHRVSVASVAFLLSASVSVLAGTPSVETDKLVGEPLVEFLIDANEVAGKRFEHVSYDFELTEDIKSGNHFGRIVGKVIFDGPNYRFEGKISTGRPGSTQMRDYLIVRNRDYIASWYVDDIKVFRWFHNADGSDSAESERVIGNKLPGSLQSEVVGNGTSTFRTWREKWKNQVKWSAERLLVNSSKPSDASYKLRLATNGLCWDFILSPESDFMVSTRRADQQGVPQPLRLTNEFENRLMGSAFPSRIVLEIGGANGQVDRTTKVVKNVKGTDGIDPRLFTIESFPWRDGVMLQEDEASGAVQQREDTIYQKGEFINLADWWRVQDERRGTSRVDAGSGLTEAAVPARSSERSLPSGTTSGRKELVPTGSADGAGPRSIVLWGCGIGGAVVFVVLLLRWSAR